MPEKYKKYLQDRVKTAYIDGRDFHSEKPHWAGYHVKQMAKVLKAFAPYLISVYDCLFMESRAGIGDAIVTAIGDEGLRVESLDHHTYEWVHIKDIPKFKLQKQQSLIERITMRQS